MSVKCIAHPHGSCSALLHALLQLQCWSLQAGGPITTLERAVSTTSLVTVRRSVLRRMRSIWVNSRRSSRKVPPIIPMIAASASRSVTSRRLTRRPSAP